MKTVVFVCTGNTCRSPMAEGIFRVLLAQHGIADTEAVSCGLGTFPGMPPSDFAVTAAADFGADIASHRSRALSQYLLDCGDLFVCMTESHRRQLLQYLSPQKIRILSDGIPDPYGGTLAQYRDCAAQIYNGLQTLIKEFL